MELVYLILPIVGAFLLLFIVCCCGKKVKELFHIPKEVVTGGYRIASTRDLDLELNAETPPRALSLPQLDQPRPPGVHFTGAPLLDDTSAETSHVFCEEITEISDSSMLTPSVRRPRLSERDSGVYSVCENSLVCGSSQGTPCPRPRWQQPREMLHSYSEDSQTSGSHRAEDSSSCIINVRSRTCSGDTNNTDPILESEYEMEDAGICIIHVLPNDSDSTSKKSRRREAPPGEVGDNEGGEGSSQQEPESNVTAEDTPQIPTPPPTQCSEADAAGGAVEGEDTQGQVDTETSEQTPDEAETTTQSSPASSPHQNIPRTSSQDAA